MSVKYVDLGTVCSVGPRDAALSADSPFIPMDAVRVGSRFPAYTEPLEEVRSSSWFVRENS